MKIKHLKTIIAVLLFFVAQQTLHAAVYYVKTDGNDSRDGLSWTNAKVSIQAALNLATTGDQIWVAAGAYTITQPLQMKEGVNVYGSMSGTENIVAQRPNIPLGTPNSATFTRLFGSNMQVLNQPTPFNTKTTWDGFSIINSNSSSNGGGAFLQSNGVLRLCNFDHCITSGMGGGVACYKGGTLDSCYISGCTAATYGGGVYAFEGTIIHTKILNNIANVSGGGLYSTYKCSITYTTISNNNSVNNGGGAYSTSECNYTLCTLNNNLSANGNGGAMYCDGSTLIKRCVFKSNQAKNGAAAYCTEGSRIDSCTATQNQAQGNGGAFYMFNGGTVSNSTFNNNRSISNGGGVYFSAHPSGIINNCTLIGNTALNGGALFFDNGGKAIYCTVKQNTSTENGGGAYLNNAARCDSSTFESNVGLKGGGIYGGMQNTFTTLMLKSNKANESGGGVFLNNGNKLTECKASTNTASQDGGGVYAFADNKVYRVYSLNNTAQRNGGGLYCNDKNRIMSSAFTNNTVLGNGGGIYSSASNNIYSSTMARNNAVSRGGGISCTAGAVMANSIVWGNNTQVYTNNTSVNITYCAVQSDTATNDSVTGDGNIRLSIGNLTGKNHLPGFYLPSSITGATTNPTYLNDVLNANWSLISASYCVDRGKNDSIQYGYSLDLQGLPHYFNNITDIGAYEWAPSWYTSATPPRAVNETARIFPNPATGLVHVSTSFLENEMGAQVKIYGANGALLYTTSITSTGELDLSAMPSGTLFIRVVGKEKSAVAKVLKIAY